ncbi:MAG TPA: carotenoid oxygenase family protein, partial [Microthrixaceae bacterium]|nr:carotenoid oxygenase family protein [Microthrixaceae bacterium]
VLKGITARPHDPAKPYWLQGNFTPVKAEETVADLSISGSIPRELSGLFVRNGSNPPSGTSLHWFLGDGMVHGVRLEGGKAKWYRNRYVQTPIHAAKKDLLDFGGIPGGANSQSNVALVHHGGKLLTTGEVGWPFQIDPEDLSTVGAWDFGGKLGTAMTAHPKIDPTTGRMHFFGYDFIESSLTYYAADPSGNIDVVSPISVDQVTMMHDFAITESDVVFWMGPVMFGADPNGPLPQVPFHWDPSGPCRVGVMPLDGSGADIRWVDIDPCFVFHGLNGHREGDNVVLNVHQAAEAFGKGGDIVDTYLTRWTIGAGGEQLSFSSDRVSDRPMDLPSHDRRHTGRQTRNGWCATTTSPTSEYGFELAGICHVDTVTGEEDVWDPGKNLRAGEGVFVPTGKAEGDGYVVTFIWDRETDLSSLAVFEAQDMKQGPIGRVELPVRVPFGFHGLWVDDSAV